MDEFIKGLSDHELAGATYLTWLITIGLWIGIASALFAIRGLYRRFLAKVGPTGNLGRSLLRTLLVSIRRIFLIGLTFVIAARIAGLPAGAGPFSGRILTIILLYQIGHWIIAVVDMGLELYRVRSEGERRAAVAAIPGIKVIVAVIVWALMLLSALERFGVNVTALVAGLGIGGLAVALALQKGLGDLLAYVTILADEPFRQADFIIVESYLGTIDNIGLRSTRVRSLSGELIVFPNSDLLASRIRNFGHMKERRVLFSFGVVYQTTPAQLAAIPGMVRGIIESNEPTRFDRAHFLKFGDSSLDFEVVYYVLAPDYNVYMDIQQRINLELDKQFLAQGIEFAYPTRTIYSLTPAEAAEAAKSRPG